MIRNEYIAFILVFAEVASLWIHSVVYQYMAEGYQWVSILSGVLVFGGIIFLSCVLWVKKEIVK